MLPYRGSGVITISLAYLHDYPVRIDQPDAAPSWDERIEAEWTQRDRDRVANPGEECVEIVGLKGDMPDGPRILRAVGRSNSGRSRR